jgi:hypothetical protein
MVIITKELKTKLLMHHNFYYLFKKKTGNIEKVYRNTKTIKLKVNRTNSGLFKCVAENEISKIERTIYLKYYG